MGMKSSHVKCTQCHACVSVIKPNTVERKAFLQLFWQVQLFAFIFPISNYVSHVYGKPLLNKPIFMTEKTYFM